jgi:glycosyltransferase involved in cell wall biosynthesis
MRIGFDLLYLVEGHTGGRETYARELIAALFEHDPSLTATAFVNRTTSTTLVQELGAAMRLVRLPVSARRPEQWAIGELGCLPFAGQRAGIEIMHSLANFGPAWGPFRRVLTVHDVRYRALRELVPTTRRIGTAALMGLAVRHAHRIIAVSGFAREELLREFSIDPTRVDVIPNGIGASAASSAASESELRERHRLGARPVVLTVASNLPHKNLGLLFASLALVDAARRPVLVLAGPGTDDESLRAQAVSAGVEPDARLLGRCDAAELEGFFRLASCLVLPSLYEGFGLPVLEAMVRDLPVLCSDIPALREITGDAALRFSPDSKSELAAAIERVLDDRDLAKRLAAAGREQAERFSWSRAAAATLDSYRAALGAGTP